MKKITNEQLEELKRDIAIRLAQELHKLCPGTRSGRHEWVEYKPSSGRARIECQWCEMLKNK